MTKRATTPFTIGQQWIANNPTANLRCLLLCEDNYPGGVQGFLLSDEDAHVPAERLYIILMGGGIVERKECEAFWKSQLGKTQPEFEALHKFASGILETVDQSAERSNSR